MNEKNLLTRIVTILAALTGLLSSASAFFEKLRSITLDTLHIQSVSPVALFAAGTWGAIQNQS